MFNCLACTLVEQGEKKSVKDKVKLKRLLPKSEFLHD